MQREVRKDQSCQQVHATNRKKKKKRVKGIHYVPQRNLGSPNTNKSRMNNTKSSSSQKTTKLYQNQQSIQAYQQYPSQERLKPTNQETEDCAEKNHTQLIVISEKYTSLLKPRDREPQDDSQLSSKWKPKPKGTAILILDKLGSKRKLVKRD